MKIYNHTLIFTTKKYMDFIDITNEVEKLIKKSKAGNGFVMVFSKHTTAAIKINEKEKGIYKDFSRFSQRLLPKKQYYHHNDLNIRTENLVCDIGASDCMNGHSHCLHLLMGGTTELVPIINRKLALGTYQRIFLIELDCSRQRKILVQIYSNEN
ncbi:YjbQ family protein [bacterium]|nr:MAG: YjbQ family protein [bacterium]